MFNSHMLRQMIASFIRTFAAPVVGWLTLRLGLAEDVVVAFVAAAITAVVMYVWSYFDKRKTEQIIEVALEMPANSSKSKLWEVVNELRK